LKIDFRSVSANSCIDMLCNIIMVEKKENTSMSFLSEIAGLFIFLFDASLKPGHFWVRNKYLVAVIIAKPLSLAAVEQEPTFPAAKSTAICLISLLLSLISAVHPTSTPQSPKSPPHPVRSEAS
jgi:hypothetical protein